MTLSCKASGRSRLGVESVNGDARGPETLVSASLVRAAQPCEVNAVWISAEPPGEKVRARRRERDIGFSWPLPRR